jgi:hypothetical protein
VRRLALLAAAFALAALAAGMVVQVPTAQTKNGACRSGGAVIPASSLPETVDLENCPIGGKVITDNGVGTVLPSPGQGIQVDALTTEGSQELEVTRSRNGTVDLEHIGDESAEALLKPEVAPASGPGECSDRAFTDWPYRVEFNLRWFFNKNTTPNELSGKRALSAIRRGTENITDSQSDCRRGDVVPHFMSFQGSTDAHAQVDASGRCSGNDRMTVVSFGDLPQDKLAIACTIFEEDDHHNRTKWSDILINRSDRKWTTNPGGRSCTGKYDLESVVTHERGHTFGLGHVSETTHGNLTMSTQIAACQSSERSLGFGDWRGLDGKYSRSYDPDNPR